MEATFTAALRDLVATATPTWFADAACRDVDPEVFHPDDANGVRRAQLWCLGSADLFDQGRPPCPVLAQCLEHALANHLEHGVWGGTSERERRRIARSRRAVAARG